MLGQFDYWKLLAGLGIFMFGMFLMEESIKKLSGRSFKILIRKYTTGKLKSIGSGMFVTSILQSSSAVSLMVLAFVGAGIMSMGNAIGVILGSNIGTTATAWIVATVGFKVKIEAFALPLIGSGGLGLIFLGRSQRYSNISKLLVGFGFLFMGLDYMKTSVEVFAEGFDISSIPNYGWIVYLLLGFLLTAIMQSSSATLAIILTTLNAGLISFDSGAALVIGANVGTTVTILLGAIGGTQIKKRVAFSHFTFNMITGIIALALLPILSFVVLRIFDVETNAVLALALFHTLFNVLGVLIFLPLINLLTRLLYKIIPDKRAHLTLYIDEADTSVPDAAIAALKKEALHLLRNVLRENLNVLQIDEKLVFNKLETARTAEQLKRFSAADRYEQLKLLQAEIFTLGARISSEELSKPEARELSRYLHAIRIILSSAKSLKDVRHNLEEFESSDNPFLNEQYTRFRKRLIETYLKLDPIIHSDHITNKELFKLLKQLRKSDKQYVKATTKAIRDKAIEDLDVSNAFVVNRAFVQSAKQVLLSLKELLLSAEENEQFEEIEEISDTLMEN